MHSFFWGFFLILLDFNLDLGAARIELLPDFAGYILLLRGAAELADLSPHFERIRPLATGMAVYTAILWGLDLLGFSQLPFAFALGLAAAALMLYITWLLVMGVRDMEPRLGRPLEADSLHGAWRFMAVLTAVLYATLLIPALGLVSLVVGLVAYLYFLYRLGRSRGLFYERGV